MKNEDGYLLIYVFFYIFQIDEKITGMKSEWILKSIILQSCMEKKNTFCKYITNVSSMISAVKFVFVKPFQSFYTIESNQF